MPLRRPRFIEPPRPKYPYAACRRLGLVHVLEIPVGPPFPKNGRRTGSLLCTRELAFIGDVFEAFDHGHERFCPPCRVAVIARHYHGCHGAAAQADSWSDEELAGLRL